MNILVCIKQVPDNAAVPKLDPATGRIDTQGMETMVSPFDLNAIEAGLHLAEANGGEVSVMSLGDESSLITLRIGLSMGAEYAYLVSDPALADSDGTATGYTLAKAIRSVGTFDLILCGKQAIDDDSAQVGACIAQELDLPQVTYVNEIRSVTADAITVKRVGSAGEEVVEAALPALLTCEKSLNEPRYPTLKRTRKANRMEIPVLTCAGVGADTGRVGAASALRVQKRYLPAPREHGELLTGEPKETGRLAVQNILALKIV